MKFEYEIDIHKSFTNLKAYKNKELVSNKHIDPEETKEWVDKLLNTRNMSFNELEPYLRTFRVRNIKIKDKNE